MVATMDSLAMSATAQRELLRFAESARRPRHRTMRQWALDEIVLPSGGPRPGRLRIDTQPWLGCWLDEVDSGRWNRFVMTGPAQAGKSLAGWVIPTLYHLFELGETVLCCVPDSDMTDDKWEGNLRPVIQRCRYRDLLPLRGEGSRGGRIEKGVRFANGAELRFMTGGESVGGVAGYTTRVVVITEVNKFQRPQEGSVEADRIELFLARCRAFGDRARVYLECTVTNEECRIWTEYQAGSASRLMHPCPACGEWVAPERRHLIGWQSAGSDREAHDGARLACPSCGVAWTDEDRRRSVAKCRLVHRGQHVSKAGEVVGAAPDTRTLSFRFSAVHNMLISLGSVAHDEYRALRDPRPESAERNLCHNVWCIPTSVGEDQRVGLDAGALLQRTAALGRGQVPSWADVVTVGCDVGKRLLHWVAVAWAWDATCHVLDYGRIEVASDDLGEDKAVPLAIAEGLEMWAKGWSGGHDRDAGPQVAVVDSGWTTDPVYRAVQAASIPAMPFKGHGSGQAKITYWAPKSRSAAVRRIGDGWHTSRLQARRGVVLLEADVDRWKAFIHARGTTPVGKPGAMTMWRTTDPREHLSFAHHLAAERMVTEHDPRRGEVTKWVIESRNNHWWDAMVMASVGAATLGVSVSGDDPKPEKQQARRVWTFGGGRAK